MTELPTGNPSSEPMGMPPTALAWCRSILYESLAIGLREPTLPGLNKLGGSEVSTALTEAAGILSQGTPISADEGLQAGDGLSPAPLVSAVRALIDAARNVTLSDLDASHQRMFGHTARGKVTPYETEYGVDDPFRQTQELADIGGFYRAFGLKMDERRHQRVDHIAAECEFLAFLTRKEAYMGAVDDMQSVLEAKRAQHLFLRDHLGRFGCAFASTLIREADGSFFRALGQLCAEHLAWECRAFGLSIGPEYIRLRSTEEDNIPMACGTCDLFPGIASTESR